MAKNEPSNATVVDKCSQRLNALKAYVSPKAQIAINGVVHKAADVIEIYQSCLDNRAGITTKRAELKAALVERASSETLRMQADRALKGWVANQFGVTSQEAIDFGFPPPKTATRTADDKALAVARAKATRAARHTMGKKQKALITGTVVVPTAPAAPANAAPTTAPTVGATVVTAPLAPPVSQAPPAPQASVVSQAPPPQPQPQQAVPPQPASQPAVQQQSPANGASAPTPVLNGSSSH